MDLSIIIINYNVYDDLIKCINSIQQNIVKILYEIIVVDNNSTERKIDKLLDDYPDVKLINNNENNGFGFANNLGVKYAKGEYLLFINPDIIINDNSLEKLYNFLIEQPGAGVVGPIQEKPGAGIEHYYTFFPGIYSRLMQEFRLYMTAPVMKYRFFEFLDTNIKNGLPFEVDWVMGSCMMMKKEIFLNIGKFDEAFFLYEEETELEFRIKKSGLKNYIIPSAKVLHNHHSSSGKLGVLFVNYQEFRSRIIFDSKRFKGIKYLIRRMFVSLSIVTRILYFSVKSVSNRSSRKKLYANYDLLKFSLRSKEEILNDRYNFNKKLKLFK